MTATTAAVVAAQVAYNDAADVYVAAKADLDRYESGNIPTDDAAYDAFAEVLLTNCEYRQTMQSIMYFIPDWDDRVDPDFDFLHDRFSTKSKNPYERDKYAHELFIDRAYDGVLVSMATIQHNTAKYRAIRELGSIHAYLRLPDKQQYQVIGDCGAFSYWQAANPPYTSQDAIDFYHHLGVNIGVSVDHLIFTQDPEERERRWKITHDNAKEFLQLYRQGNYSFIPFGVAQGWDPESYQRAAQELLAMGYEAIAIGGLVRSKTEDILAILESIQEVVPTGIRIHLFGVNRPEAINDFMRKGVTSFDSASRLRRAWMDDRDNYFIGNNGYSAIRIPDAARVAKLLPDHQNECLQIEHVALQAIRDYEHYTLSLNETLDTILAYDDLGHKLKYEEVSAVAIESARLQRRNAYTRTLSERIWEQCSCNICRQVGVEVIIFRGNNRNRRRGFHNTWQLYRDIQVTLRPLQAAQLTFFG